MANTRILVVDDDHRKCEFLAATLSREGYGVDTALDGKAALGLAAERPYALALLDFRMPDMNGDEVYRRITASQPELIGIFLTGYPTLDTVFPAVQAGAARVLAKPVDAVEVTQLVAECLKAS